MSEAGRTRHALLLRYFPFFFIAATDLGRRYEPERVPQGRCAASTESVICVWIYPQHDCEKFEVLRRTLRETHRSMQAIPAELVDPGALVGNVTV
ncbi:hypothetical protein MRX96_000635 [Rhipicephalus microplus]